MGDPVNAPASGQAAIRMVTGGDGVTSVMMSQPPLSKVSTPPDLARQKPEAAAQSYQFPKDSVQKHQATVPELPMSPNAKPSTRMPHKLQEKAIQRFKGSPKTTPKEKADTSADHSPPRYLEIHSAPISFVAYK